MKSKDILIIELVKFSKKLLSYLVSYDINTDKLEEELDSIIEHIPR